MTYLALVDAILAIAMVLWVRALTRARGEDIPCTTGIFSWTVVAAGLVAMVAIVVANVLVLKAFDAAFGKHLSPVVFVVWLLAMSAAAIIFVIALTTLHINRTAAAWLRVEPPAGLVLRVAGESTSLNLEPGSVRALGLEGAIGGALYVHYDIRLGGGSLALSVPFTPDAGLEVERTPFLRRSSGLVAQGDPRTLHRYFLPFRG